MKPASTVEASIKHTSIGRIVVPPHVPSGFRLFYTTIDIDGRITPELLQFIDAPLASCNQVHGAAVHDASNDALSLCEDRLQPVTADRLKPVLTQKPEPECDALWTDKRPMALAIKVADCLPISLIDTGGVMANIHSGWRGTVQNITAATLDVTPLDPKTTTAWLGPAIRVCCFEVGEDVAALFDAGYVDRTRGPKPHVDTAAVVADVLRSRGFDRIIDTGLCTRCEGSIFHSYRRRKQGGRNLAIVAQ